MLISRRSSRIKYLKTRLVLNSTIMGYSMGTELNEMYFMKIFSNNGCFVIAPDYEGPNAAFSTSIQEGQATLDSISAALLTSKTTGISHHAKGPREVIREAQFLLIGQLHCNQRMLKTYAKYLKANLVGTAIGGLISNINSTTELLDGDAHVGLTVAAVIGLANEYLVFKEAVQSDFFPNTTAQFNEIYSLFMIPDGPYFSEKSFSQDPRF